MTKFTSHIKRLAVALLLLISFLDTAVTVIADEVLTPVSGYGVGGADYKSVTNGSITTDAAHMNAVVNSAAGGPGASTVWNSLNVAPQQSLDFHFLTAGQTAMNYVMGQSMSVFAGAVTTSGVGGNVAVSNPNGMLLMNDVYFSVAGALTLTTKDMTLNNGALSLSTATGVNEGTIQIGQGNTDHAAVLRIGKDFNVVAPGIKIDGADILAGTDVNGGNIRLITADGVNFLATGAVNSVANTNSKARTFDIIDDLGNTITTSVLVKDSALAVKNNTNGKVYFITKGNSDTASIAAFNSAIDGKIAMDVDGNATFGLIGNADIVGMSDTQKSHVKGNLVAKTIDSTINLNSNTTVNGTTTTITVRDFLVSKSYDLSTPDKIKTALNTEFKVGDDVTDLMASQLGATYQTVIPSSTTSTTTTYSGKGGISIANTIVDKKITLNGAGIGLLNTTAKDFDLTSTTGTPVTMRRTEGTTNYKTTTTYGWKTTATGTVNGDWVPDTYKTVVNVPGHYEQGALITPAYDEVYVLGHYEGGYYKNLFDWSLGTWVAGKYVKATFSYSFSLWVDSNGKSIEHQSPLDFNHYNAVYAPNQWVATTYKDEVDIPGHYLTKTVATAGAFSESSSTGLVPDGSSSSPTITTLYNPSTTTVGTINISGVTTTNNGNLVATAVNNIIASGIKVAGNANLTSTGSSVELRKNASFNNGVNSVNKNLIIDAATAADIVGANVKGYTAAFARGGNLTITDSALNNSNSSAYDAYSLFAPLSGQDITINNSTVKFADVQATRDLKILGNSTLVASAAGGKNSLLVENSAISGSLISSDKDVHINGSSVSENSAVNSGISTWSNRLGDIYIDNSTVSDSTLLAHGNTNLLNGSTAERSMVFADRDLSLTGGSSITNPTFQVRAGQDLKMANGSFIKNADLSVGRDMEMIDQSALITSTARVAGAMSAVNSSIINSIINANTISVNGINTSTKVNDPYTLDGATLNATNNVNITNTNATGQLTATSQQGNVNLNTVSGKAEAKLTGKDINVLNSAIKSADIKATGNVNVEDSLITRDITVAADGNASFKGIYVGNNLTVTKAKDVLVANSTRKANGDRPSILDLTNGAAPIDDYNWMRFDDEHFDGIASGYGVKYGEGTKISYIGGNLDISNADSARIINAAVIDNVTANNVTGDVDLITSYVGGTFDPNRTTVAGDESVYQSFIKGSYKKYYPDKNIDELNKLKYGSGLDTVFRQQFTPRGFAASEDQLKAMKRNTLSSVVKGKSNNSFKFGQGFTAY